MYEAKALEDYGTWIRKGEITMIPDHLVLGFQTKGIIDVIEYHLTNKTPTKTIKSVLKDLRDKRKVIDLKIEAYEKLNKKIIRAPAKILCSLRFKGMKSKKKGR